MALFAMHRAGREGPSGYGGGGGSPVGISAAIAVHALVAGAFILMPKEVIKPYVPQIFIGNQIPLDPPPPPEQQAKPPESKVPARTTTDPGPAKTDSLVDLPGSGTAPLITGGGVSDGWGSGEVVLSIDPPRDPVLVEAGIDPRALAAFQPDYPGSMVRLGMEGSVTVRVAIGPDGKVTGIERLAATGEAFWIATQRHALRKWRFRPATRDGIAIASSKVMTIHFRLTDR